MLDLIGEDLSNKNGLEARLALGNLIRKRGDLDRAEKMLQETLMAARATGDRDLIAAVLFPVALVEKDREHLDDARRHLDEVLQEMEESGTKDGLGRVLFASAELALRLGDVERVKRELAKGIARATSRRQVYSSPARSSMSRWPPPRRILGRRCPCRPDRPRRR